MANKEATVYIVDVGLSMGDRNSGRQETNLDFALEYVWDKITTTVATGRKTAMAGVIALRTDGTQNELETDPAYHNISVLQEISQIQMAELRKLRSELILSGTSSGDAVSAIIIAIQMIERQCRKLKYTRRILSPMRKRR
jgi:ATP-dependent DNA helicase 2 subunit 2